MNKHYLIKEVVNGCKLTNGKIKYCLLFRYFRTSVFIYSFFVVSALLFLSKPAEAMPYVYNASFYPACKHVAYVQTTAVDCDTPTTSDTIKNAAAQGGWFHISENDKQVSNKPVLHNVSIRAVFSNTDIIGGLAPEDFQEYDVAVNLRLPWAWYSKSGWGTDIRLMASAGVLYGAGETALVASLIPLVTLGSQDGRFTLDMGAGGAILSKHKFGTQDFGGHFQFALTAGVGIPLFKRLGVGYRYLHYSDAAIYGPRNTGADFHMLELTYRF